MDLPGFLRRTLPRLLAPVIYLPICHAKDSPNLRIGSVSGRSDGRLQGLVEHQEGQLPLVVMLLAVIWLLHLIINLNTHTSNYFTGFWGFGLVRPNGCKIH